MSKLDSVSTQVASWLKTLENSKKQRSKSSLGERKASLGKIKLTKIDTTGGMNGPAERSIGDKTS